MKVEQNYVIDGDDIFQQMQKELLLDRTVFLSSFRRCSFLFSFFWATKSNN